MHLHSVSAGHRREILFFCVAFLSRAWRSTTLPLPVAVGGLQGKHHPKADVNEYLSVALQAVEDL